MTGKNLLARSAVLIAITACIGLQAPQPAAAQEPAPQVARASATEAPEPSEALRRLAPYVGSWKVKLTRPGTGEPPRELTSDTRWSLGGRFLESRYRGPDVSGMLLTTYDPSRKRYRRWQFDASGEVLEYEGRWDAEAKLLRFEHASPDRGYSIVVESEVSDAGESWTLIVKDDDGQQLDEYHGNSRRVP